MSTPVVVTPRAPRPRLAAPAGPDAPPRQVAPGALPDRSTAEALDRLRDRPAVADLPLPAGE